MSGKMAINARNIAPGSVIRVNILSMNSAVRFPGLIPGMNPPDFFMLSARSTGFNTIAV